MIQGLVFHEVTPDCWADLERIFQAPGTPKHCWCMVWRSMPRRERADSVTKKATMERRVREGIPVGILGYRDGEPVAWYSIAPRATYRDLGGQGGQPVNSSVDPDSPSYRFTGFFSSFRPAGFQEAGMAGTRRHVMHLTLQTEP